MRNSRIMTVGIDLGTTTTLVARLQPDGKPLIIENLDGELFTPSVVFFEAPGKHLVGTHARAELAAQAHRVVETVKNHMGEEVAYDFDNVEYRPEEVSAIILKSVLDGVRQTVGEAIDGAVITVPASMGDSGREATRAAAAIAGIPLLGLLDEPVAAALAYAARQGPGDRRTLLVYDLGGGTFDVTVVRLEANGDFRVLATDGDRALGGKDWDAALGEVMVQRHLHDTGRDVMRDEAAYQRVLRSAEIAKKGFSRKESQFLTVEDGQSPTRFEMTRRDFETLTFSHLRVTLSTAQSVIDRLQASGELPRGWPDIDEILLAGGSSRMPAVLSGLQEMSARPIVNAEVDRMVAEGAAIYAAMLATKGTTTSVGTVPEIPEIAPEVRKRLEAANVATISTFAVGISVRETATGRLVNDVIIPSGSPLPASREVEYGSPGPGTMAEIPILEGADPEIDRCRRLGKGQLRISADSRADTLIRVKIGVSQDGLVQVSAHDPVGKTEISFRLARDGAMSETTAAAAKHRLSLAVVE